MDSTLSREIRIYSMTRMSLEWCEQRLHGYAAVDALEDFMYISGFVELFSDGCLFTLKECGDSQVQWSKR